MLTIFNRRELLLAQSMERQADIHAIFWLKTELIIR